jgi:hypothetical protein
MGLTVGACCLPLLKDVSVPIPLWMSFCLDLLCHSAFSLCARADAAGDAGRTQGGGPERPVGYGWELHAWPAGKSCGQTRRPSCHPASRSTASNKPTHSGAAVRMASAIYTRSPCRPEGLGGKASPSTSASAAAAASSAAAFRASPYLAAKLKQGEAEALSLGDTLKEACVAGPMVKCWAAVDVDAVGIGAVAAKPCV